MKTYVLLLRGINVSGHKKIKMTALDEMLTNLGLQNVQTYIQSGNVVFRSKETSKKILEDIIEKNIVKTFKFQVSVLLFESKEFEKIIKKSPYTSDKIIEENKSYFVFFKTAPAISLTQNLSPENYNNEEFLINDYCVYLNCKLGYGQAKCNNNFFENKLKVIATTRNFKTISKLLQMAN